MKSKHRNCAILPLSFQTNEARNQAWKDWEEEGLAAPGPSNPSCQLSRVAGCGLQSYAGCGLGPLSFQSLVKMGRGGATFLKHLWPEWPPSPEQRAPWRVHEARLPCPHTPAVCAAAQSQQRRGAGCDGALGAAAPLPPRQAGGPVLGPEARTGKRTRGRCANVQVLGGGLGAQTENDPGQR